MGFWAVSGLLVGAASLIADLPNDAVWQFTVFVALTAVVVGVGAWITERRYLAEGQRLADEAGITDA